MALSATPPTACHSLKFANYAINPFSRRQNGHMELTGSSSATTTTTTMAARSRGCRLIAATEGRRWYRWAAGAGEAGEAGGSK